MSIKTVMVRFTFNTKRPKRPPSKFVQDFLDFEARMEEFAAIARAPLPVIGAGRPACQRGVGDE